MSTGRSRPAGWSCWMSPSPTSPSATSCMRWSAARRMPSPRCLPATRRRNAHLRRWGRSNWLRRLVEASIASGATCSRQARRPRASPWTRWSCFRLPAKGARLWRSRAASCARRAAAFGSTASPLRCARRSSTQVCSSTRWNAPAFPPALNAARGGRIRPGARSSRWLPARRRICPLVGSRSICRSDRCRTARQPRRPMPPIPRRRTKCSERLRNAPTSARKLARRANWRKRRRARSGPHGNGSDYSPSLASSRLAIGGSGG